MASKITILGDIMCEPSMLAAARQGNTYNFDKVFENMKEFLAESDYVIGNLETPLAGEEAGFTKSMFSFNAPDAFADAVKNAGIDMVLTANNHCLDRGIDGLVRTVRILTKKGIPFAGTCGSADERKEAACFEVNGLKAAVVSYTYGTNYAANHIRLEGEQRLLVNLLRPQDERYFVPQKAAPQPFFKKAANRILSKLPEKERYSAKKLLGMAVSTAHADDSLNRETAEEYLVRMREDIARAKENADLVLFCPHIGGQFNAEPGAFSEYVVREAVACGCAAVAASHAHVVLRAETMKGVPCFYSLGNFSMSPNSPYLPQNNLPSYGIAAHFYIEGNTLQRTTFSVLKMIEEKNHILSVWPADRLYAVLSGGERKELTFDISRIVHKVTGRDMGKIEICPEYDLASNS